MCRSAADPDGPRTCSSHGRKAFATVEKQLADVQSKLDAVEAEIAVRAALAADERPSVEQLEAAGYLARVEGRGPQPALDNVVRKALDGAEVGDPKNIEAMKAFQRGWDTRTDEEIAALFGEDDAATSPTPSPHTNEKVMSTVANGDVDSAKSVMKSYGEGHKAARTQATLTQHRAAETAAAEQVMRTRGPRGGTPEASEAIHSQYQAALAAHDDPADAWESKAFVQARREFGPGSSRYENPMSIDDPEQATTRELIFAENDMFYHVEKFPDAAGRHSTTLAHIRRVLTARGFGPKYM